MLLSRPQWIPAGQQLLLLLLLSGRESLASHIAGAAVKSLSLKDARYDAADQCPPDMRLPSRLLCCCSFSVPESGLQPNNEVCSYGMSRSGRPFNWQSSHLNIPGGPGDPLLNGTLLFSSQRCVVLVGIFNAATDASASLQVQIRGSALSRRRLCISNGDIDALQGLQKDKTLQPQGTPLLLLPALCCTHRNDCRRSPGAMENVYHCCGYTLIATYGGLAETSRWAAAGPQDEHMLGHHTSQYYISNRLLQLWDALLKQSLEKPDLSVHATAIHCAPAQFHASSQARFQGQPRSCQVVQQGQQKVQALQILSQAGCLAGLWEQQLPRAGHQAGMCLAA